MSFPLNLKIIVGKVLAATQERGEERRGSDADQNQGPERDAETMELLSLIEKHPAVVLTLLVRTRDRLSGAWLEFVIHIKLKVLFWGES